MNRKPLDYNIYFQGKFGKSVLANHEIMAKNTLALHKLDTIYLLPNYKANGGHYLYHIQTNKMITQSGKINVVPITDDIVNFINKQD